MWFVLFYEEVSSFFCDVYIYNYIVSIGSCFFYIMKDIEKIVYEVKFVVKL